MILTGITLFNTTDNTRATSQTPSFYTYFMIGNSYDEKLRFIETGKPDKFDLEFKQR